MTSTLFVEELKGRTTGTNANKVIVPSGQTLKVDSSLLVDNNRLAFDAAGHLQVKSGGLTINTVGQALGVGTNNPGHAIEVKHTAPEIMLEETSSGGSKRLSLGVTSGGLPFINAEQSGGAIAMNMTGTEVARFNSNGLSFPSGKGIDFSATSDGAGANRSELLDDYEEGTWTATMPRGGSVTMSSSYYVKVGAMVYAGAYITCSGQPSEGNLWRIGGLPYAVKSGSHYHAAGSITYSHNTNVNNWMAPTPYSGGGSELYFHRNDGTSTAIAGSQAQGIQYLIFALVYITDS